jgi:hypothetical protein
LYIFVQDLLKPRLGRRRRASWRQERTLERTTRALRIATKARVGALTTAMNFSKSTRRSCWVSLRMLSNIAWLARWPF